MYCAQCEEIPHVVHEPGLAGAIRGVPLTGSGTAHVETWTVLPRHIANEAVGNCARHRAPLVTRNRIVPMMVPRWIERAGAFEHAQVVRVLAQHPVHLVHCKP